MNKPDAVEQFNSKLCSQAKKIFKALKSRSHAGIPSIAKKIGEECSEHGHSAPKALRIIDLLACYFKEDVKSVYQLFERTAFIHLGWLEVELAEVLSSLQAAPIIIVFGDNLVIAEKFCVSIEKIVMMRCTDFISALVYTFCAFFVFDMRYPDTYALTYEFIPRYFVGINTAGTRSKKRQKYAIHPKVMKLGKLVE
uniref:uncharacterized protein LOC120326794 n=1 Tax=Styela clava TaxID=7725 RepID=UPI001939EC5F|nr:uncharacterized protein LOC120326794 [Styela clava]